MILTVLALSLAIAGPQDAKPVTLNRVFTKGEKVQYAVNSNLHTEVRPYGLQTFMPQDMDLNYKFSIEVKDMKADGIAVLHYLRPNLIQVEGETFDTPAKTTVDKLDMNYDLTVSPINKILGEKNLNPPKKKTPKPSGGDDGGGGAKSLGAGRGPAVRRLQNPLGAILGQFINELYRLALNIGPIDSSLDFSPKLPLDDVKVGDTWKETVGYEPQILKGKEGNKQAVQRLDYTFTFLGVANVNGKNYYHINAGLDMKADLGSFINQLVEAKPDQTGLKSIPLNLKQSIDFYLDMATKRTVMAHATADGGFKVNITEIPDEPVHEEKIHGTTDMHIIAMGTATPPKAGHGKQSLR
jgi:hypothetical protein